MVENDTSSRDIIPSRADNATVLNSRAPQQPRAAKHTHAHKHVTDPVRLDHVSKYEGRGEDSLLPRTR